DMRTTLGLTDDFDPRPNIGPIDQIRGGAFNKDLIGADFTTGLILRFDEVDGTPSIYSTEAQITLATGAASAEMSLPRSLITNQVIAQDTVSGHILVFALNGDAQIHTDSRLLAIAAGRPGALVAVAGWARGARTLSQYAWFNSTSTIVQVPTTGGANTHVDGAALRALFPDIQNLSVLQLAGDPAGDQTPAASGATDGLVVLVGSAVSGRGLALALVTDAGGPEVFTTENQLENLLGANYDLSRVDLLNFSGIVYAIDVASSQVLGFEPSGTPVVIGARDDLRDVAGTPNVFLSVSSPLSNGTVDGGILVFEASSEDFILVD
ncbi:MAG: hypothetical protein MK538_10945, partial [Planctomycetes bacterium]|nr:hypothetical protein [Planctomycetota bacterium]